MHVSRGFALKRNTLFLAGLKTAKDDPAYLATKRGSVQLSELGQWNTDTAFGLVASLYGVMCMFS